MKKKEREKERKKNKNKKKDKEIGERKYVLFGSNFSILDFFYHNFILMYF